jgi:hypothetical protein
MNGAETLVRPRRSARKALVFRPTVCILRLDKQTAPNQAPAWTSA